MTEQDPGTVVPRPDALRAIGELGLEARSFTPIGGSPRWRPGRATYRGQSGDR